MVETMIILIFIMLLLILFAICFVLGSIYGFYCRKDKRPNREQKPLTAEILAEKKREQKELENFMNYTGKPQEAING